MAAIEQVWLFIYLCMIGIIPTKAMSTIETLLILAARLPSWKNIIRLSIPKTNSGIKIVASDA